MKLRSFAAITTAAIVLSTGSTEVLAQAAGSDNFGNTITGSPVDPSVPTNLFFDISATAPILISGDDVVSGDIPLGLVFPFYDETTATLNFNTNGFASPNAPGSGNDRSNDAVLPTLPSTGGGARIYAHHDDTEAVVYGAHFDADDSPFGTEAFISQFNACHFPCTPNVNLDIQYNIAFLRDGTVIMAHNLAGPEGGSGATIGIQNAAATDGVAYSADDPGSIVNGMTILVIPQNSGISSDLEIIAAETGLNTTAASVRDIHNHTGSVLRRGANPSNGVVIEPTGTGSLNALGGVTADGSRHLWATGLGTAVDGDIGSDLTIKTLGIQAGADLLTMNAAVFGIAAGHTVSQVSLGASDLTAKNWSISPYAGIRFGDWILSAVAGYAYTSYEQFNLPFLQGIDSDGDRFFGSASLTSDFDLGRFVLSPTITATGGGEAIGDWSVATVNRSVDDASFFQLKGTAKFSAALGENETAYVLLGGEFITTSGDDGIALFATDYEKTRGGGIVGAGFDIDADGFTLAIAVGISGIGSDLTSYDGSARVVIDF